MLKKFSTKRKYKEGLFLVMRDKAAIITTVDHYAIFDSDNYLGYGKNKYIQIGQGGFSVEKNPEKYNWRVLGKAMSIGAATERFEKAKKNYNTVLNNCEHFARYVITGRKESKQVKKAFVKTGVVLGAFALVKTLIRPKSSNNT